MERKTRHFANTVFFPAAAAHAAVMLPWSVAGMLGVLSVPPGIATAAGHGHEMLFGFALAVVAGYLLGPQPRSVTWPLFTLWLLARILWLFWPASVWASAANLLFVLAIAGRVLPRFWGAAKKWRNRSVIPVIGGLVLTALVFLWPGVARSGQAATATLMETILLLTVLMFFMGGRVIAPAVAGHVVKRGGEQKARVQPRIEGAGLLLLFGALLLQPFPSPWTRGFAGALLLAAAVLILIRLLRWRPWRCRDRADLICLQLGYGWLAAGTALAGLSLLSALPVTLALHGITVGALGTLTLAVMIRTRQIILYRTPRAGPALVVAVVFVGLAALGRLGAGLSETPRNTLLVAAGCWSLAWWITLGVLLRLTRRREVR